MNKLNRKGVSPLIATVLLIAFAVALGAVVMNWGRAYVEDTTKFAEEKSNIDVKCSMDVGLDFVTINSVKQVCFNSTAYSVNFTIENGPSADVSALQIRVFDDRQNINVTTITTSLPKAYVAKYGVSYPSSFSNISKIEIIPQINVQGSEKTAFCPRNSLSENNPLQCNY